VECHCGCRRSSAEAYARAQAAVRRSAPEGSPRPLATTLLLAACGLLLYAAIGRSVPAGLTDGRGRTTREGHERTQTYPPLPPAAPAELSEEQLTSEPEPTAETGPVVPPPEAAPPGDGVDTPAAADAIAADPAPPPSPGAGGLEEMRRRAASLEPRLAALAAEADALDARYASYVAACDPSRAERAASRPVSGAESTAARNWFAIWSDAPAGGDPSGIRLDADAPIADCALVRTDLVSAADVVADGLADLEETARANGVLPGHVRDMLARHRLSGWRESRERRRYDMSRRSREEMER
jgi:hypothetical protein